MESPWHLTHSPNNDHTTNCYLKSFSCLWSRPAAALRPEWHSDRQPQSARLLKNLIIQNYSKLFNCTQLNLETNIGAHLGN